jgi:hypothetical protein
MKKEKTTDRITEEDWRKLATREWVSDDLDIDEDAEVSLVADEESGRTCAAWVEAWVYVTIEEFDV